MKRKTIERIVIDLEAMIDQARQAIIDAGGCDHSVGICCCAELRAIERAEATAKKLSQWMKLK